MLHNYRRCYQPKKRPTEDRVRIRSCVDNKKLAKAFEMKEDNSGWMILFASAIGLMFFNDILRFIGGY